MSKKFAVRSNIYFVLAGLGLVTAMVLNGKTVIADQTIPGITGGALDGTAGRYSELEIEIFPDSTKDVEIFFLNQDFPYEHREPRRPAPHAPEAILSFDWDDVPVKISIYPSAAERTPRRGRGRLAGGRGHRRRPPGLRRPWRGATGGRQRQRGRARAQPARRGAAGRLRARAGRGRVSRPSGRG